MLVVIGPSGAGKSTVVRALSQGGLLRVHPTWTTRPRRPDEARDALEHVFVPPEEFDRLDAEGFFLGTAQPFGLSHRYGLPHLPPAADGAVDTVMLRAPMVERFAEVVGRPVVYQLEDGPERAARRLQARGDPADEIRCRLERHEQEVRWGRQLARRVFVNDRPLPDLVAAVGAAVRADFGLPLPAGASAGTVTSWGARRPAPPPALPWSVPPPPVPAWKSAESERARRVWRIVNIVAALVAAGILVLGLVALALFLLMLSMLSGSSWSSNK